MEFNKISPLLDMLLQGWREYQEQLVAMMRLLTPEQLTARAAPDLRCAGEIVAHIVAARAIWFCDILHEEDEEVAALAAWGTAEHTEHTAGKYIDGLEQTWRLIQHALARWTDSQMTEPITLAWLPGHPVTRAFAIWHLIEHDLHHGGELTHTLGTQGVTVELLPPPPQNWAIAEPVALTS